MIDAGATWPLIGGVAMMIALWVLVRSGRKAVRSIRGMCACCGYDLEGLREPHR